jgi:hypothetical protein
MEAFIETVFDNRFFQLPFLEAFSYVVAFLLVGAIIVGLTRRALGIASPPPAATTREEREQSEGEKGAGAEAARLAFDADEHRTAKKEWQSPIECREITSQVVIGGVSRVHEELCIGHLKGHDRLAAARARDGR